MTQNTFGNSNIKEPNVSGQFYSSNPTELKAHLTRFFSKAQVNIAQKPVSILIAPHAGYVYSGFVASHGFKAIGQQPFKTIVILAPSHFYGFDGISVWPEGGFKTPLGIAEVDQDFAKQLLGKNEKIYFEDKAFIKEHSLEVEIPFLQHAYKNFKIVPVVMGQPSLQLLQEFAQNLRAVIADRQDVLIVVSTDLSHYHPYETAQAMDERSIDAIKNFKVEQIWNECHLRTMEMCGCVPVVAALIYARLKGLNESEVLTYANSGDVSGQKDSVVGYTSILIYNSLTSKKKEPASPSSFSEDQQKKLLSIARRAIVDFVREGRVLEVKEKDPRLNAEEGAFVTIHKHGQLRGCIGNVLGKGPLYLTVRDMAIAAASEDPRFPPISVDELDDIDVEISVLSKPRLIKNIDEIQLGVHGVILRQGPFNQGLFLPQVATETGWNKERFLSELSSQKARLPADAWRDPRTKLEVFTADIFSEKNN